MGLVFRLTVAFLISCVAPSVFGVHHSLCIRLPPDEVLDADTEYQPYKSVGVEKFPQKYKFWNKYKFKHDPGAPAGGNWDWYFNEEFNFEMKIYPLFVVNEEFIAQGRARKEPLSGWFRVQLSLPLYKGFVGFIKSFILFANDEQGNVVGHWEHDPFKTLRGFGTAKCPPSSATKHMVIPCGGTSKYEATPSNMILYAHNRTVKHSPWINNYKDPDEWPEQYKSEWPIVPDYYDKTAHSYYFRYTVQPSNKNKGPNSFIIIRVIADVDANFFEDALYNQYVFATKLISASAHFSIRPGAIPGSYDALPDDLSKIDCSRQIGSYDKKYRDEQSAAGVKDDDFWKLGYSLDGRGWLWFFHDFWGDQKWEREYAKAKRGEFTGNMPKMFDFTINTKSGCLGKYYEGRCDATICSNTKNKASLTLIPQVKAKAKCTCPAAADNQLCFDEAADAPKYFNNEPIDQLLSCKALFEHQFKSPTSGKNQGGLQPCPKNQADALKEEIKAVRWGKLKPYVYNGSESDEVLLGSGNRKNRTQSEIREEVTQRGVRVFGIGTVLYGIRKGHGFIMLILTFFCVPVASFASRYMKETFMSANILYAKIWFQIHLQLTFCMAAFMFAGLGLALVSRTFLGTSLSPWAISHRVIGWTSCGVFCCLLSLGGIRCYDDPCRCFTIFLHCGVGYFFYLLNIMSVWTSIRTPGSPSATVDVSHHDQVEQMHILEMVTVAWIGFEIAMQITMSVLLCIYDKWMAVTPHRIYIPRHIGVPIPVLKENLESDASGAGIRLVMFFVYIGFAVVATFFSVFLLKHINSSSPYDNEIGFGPMSCTHADIKTFYQDAKGRNFHPSCTTWMKEPKNWYRINF